MKIENARVYTPEHRFEKKTIAMREGVFAPPELGEESLDAEGLYAVPGLVDIHFHGCMGVDFCDGTPEALATISRYEAAQGVTSICPATMSYTEDILTGICRNAAEAGQTLPGAQLVGINMEGPFISKAKKGAQNGDYILPPDVGMFHRLQAESGGLIKLVDLAPEIPGAMEFIRALAGQVVLSIAHTAADYDTAAQAIRCGASHLTHLYNAMPPLLHRAPGVIGAGMDGGCEAEVIADGVHLHPAAVRAAFRLFGEDKIILISDSMMATGLADGEYTLGGQAVQVRGNLATLADGTLAGSATNLLGCLQVAVQKMEIPLETAVRAATENPARCLGLANQLGSIQNGMRADLLLLNEQLEPVGVFVGGCLFAGAKGSAQ